MTPWNLNTAPKTRPRSRLAPHLVVPLVLASLAGVGAAQPSSRASQQPAPDRSAAVAVLPAERITRGSAFLTNLFDAELGLLPEYAGAKVFWLYHDNYLAAKLLDSTRPDLSGQIRRTIQRHGVSRSGKIEMIFDEVPDPLPFRIPELVTVTNLGGRLVRTEILTSREQHGWKQYADLLFLAAFAQASTHPAEARSHFDAALGLWDGRGFADQATKHSGIYATYKLALAILTARRLKAPLPMRTDILERLASLQAPSGGWITDYSPDGRPRGLANVETTCLVLLALQTIHVDTP